MLPRNNLVRKSPSTVARIISTVADAIGKGATYDSIRVACAKLQAYSAADIKAGAAAVPMTLQGSSKPSLIAQIEQRLKNRLGTHERTQF